MTGWKITTHDYRPPLQGGDPIFGGTFPQVLAPVEVDESDAECGAGWNFCRTIADGFPIAGMWRDGRPSAIFACETDGPVVVRKGTSDSFPMRVFKIGHPFAPIRTGSLTLTRFATDEEIRAGLREFSAMFGAHAEAMAEEQWFWRVALGRPNRDKQAVVDGLNAALAARGLAWTLKEYPDAVAARDGRSGYGKWNANRGWDAWVVWTGPDIPDTRGAPVLRYAWDAWPSKDGWSVRDAWDARDALTVQFGGMTGLITCDPAKLTVGIRDAYRNGLGILMPTGPSELGWCMER